MALMAVVILSIDRRLAMMINRWQMPSLILSPELDLKVEWSWSKSSRVQLSGTLNILWVVPPSQTYTICQKCELSCIASPVLFCFFPK